MRIVVGHGPTLSHDAGPRAGSGYHRGMPYVLAAFAIVVPVLLVVQTIRGRVRMQCCAVEPSHDLRMRTVPEPSGREGASRR